MRALRRLRHPSIAASMLLGCCLASPAAAQDQPPPPPPSGFQQQYPQGAQGAQPPPPPGYPAQYPGGYPGAYPGGFQPPMGPKTMPYEDGDPVPPGYHVDTHVRKGLVIGGAVTFGSVYLLTALSAAVAQSAADGVGSDADEATPLYIPVAGPFIAMGTLNAEGGGIFALALVGVAQAAGLGMFITGMAAPKTELVRNDIGALDKPQVRLAPVASKRGEPGLSLVGSF
ncbi:MAG: hypothetical protein WKG00_41595 [Polyangiaceae bacterium]